MVKVVYKPVMREVVLTTQIKPEERVEPSPGWGILLSTISWTFKETAGVISSDPPCKGSIYNGTLQTFVCLSSTQVVCVNLSKPAEISVSAVLSSDWMQLTHTYLCTLRTHKGFLGYRCKSGIPLSAGRIP